VFDYHATIANGLGERYFLRSMFRNVLVPLDPGFTPRMSLIAAASLAGEGANITLLHVVNVREFAPGAAITALVEDAVERYDATVREAIRDALAILSEYGATASTFVVRGGPVHDAINRVAKNIMADVILMGTHGRRGLARAFRGSVTEDVVRKARIPVLVIRESPTMRVPVVSSTWTAERPSIES
jgi:nucleotide-binding universal stress UspA family protein